MEDKLELRILFSERLALLIKYKGLTNVELARAIKVSPGLITKYTSGKASPSYENFVKIADFFDVSMDYLRGKSNSFNGDPGDDKRIDAWIGLLETMNMDEYEQRRIVEALRLLNRKLN